MSTFVEYLETLSAVDGFGGDVSNSAEIIFKVMNESVPSFKSILVSLLIKYIKALNHANEKDIETLRAIKSGISLFYNNNKSQQLLKSQQRDESNKSDLRMTAETAECKTKAQGKYQQQTFNVQSLQNEIFQHLNYESSLNCRKVNRQWMYGSYDPCSMYHINTNDLYKLSIQLRKKKLCFRCKTYDDSRYDSDDDSDYDSEKKSSNTHFCDDLYFLSNIRSLTINEWPNNNDIIEYFSTKVFAKLKKVKIVKIVANGFMRNVRLGYSIINDNGCDAIRNMLKENASTIESVCIDRIDNDPFALKNSRHRTVFQDVEPSEWLTNVLNCIDNLNFDFPILTQLHVSNVVLSTFPLFLMKNVWLGSRIGQNYKRKRVVTVTATVLKKEFFIGLSNAIANISGNNERKSSKNNNELSLGMDELVLNSIYVTQKDVDNLLTHHLPQFNQIIFNHFKNITIGNDEEHFAKYSERFNFVGFYNVLVKLFRNHMPTNLDCFNMNENQWINIEIKSHHKKMIGFSKLS